MKAATDARVLLAVLSLSLCVLPEAAAETKFSAAKPLEHKFPVAPRVIKADIDKDGDLDFCAFKQYSGFPIAWLENKGNGKLVHRDIDPDITYVFHMAAGDIDKDGDIDLLAHGNVAGLVWYENLKGGKAFSRHDIANPGRAVSVGIIDVDNDGKKDVVYVNDDQVGWARNEDGKGGKWSELQPLVKGGGKDLRAADMDRDGDEDVVLVLNGRVTVLTNDQGSFEAKSVAAAGEFLAVSDLDQDGYPDIVWSEGSDIYVLENVEGKAFASQELTSGDLVLFENVDVGDFDGNGRVDVIAARSDRPASIFFNDGDGKWTEEVFFKDPSGRKKLMYAVDMDGDKKQDIVAVPTIDGGLYWLKNSTKR
jgi:hypothetical protein